MTYFLLRDIESTRMKQPIQIVMTHDLCLAPFIAHFSMLENLKEITGSMLPDYGSEFRVEFYGSSADTPPSHFRFVINGKPTMPKTYEKGECDLDANLCDIGLYKKGAALDKSLAGKLGIDEDEEDEPESNSVTAVAG